jgi:hypothetical protein
VTAVDGLEGLQGWVGAGRPSGFARMVGFARLVGFGVEVLRAQLVFGGVDDHSWLRGFVSVGLGRFLGLGLQAVHEGGDHYFFVLIYMI